jgi:amino-acid N-acetyltransferase
MSNPPIPSPLRGPVTVRAACHDDVCKIPELMRPFVARGELLPRTTDELVHLLRHAFVAEADGRLVGFAALEIYSRKLSEIQCLSFEEGDAGQAIAARLAHQCAERARAWAILEVMAVVSTSLEDALNSAGFHFSLPRQKRAMFIRSGHADPPPQPPTDNRSGAVLRPAQSADLSAVTEFTAPFVAEGDLLPRRPEELHHLLTHAFIAQAEQRVVGFAALEIYSPKLAEIQCLSVDAQYRGQGVGKRLVTSCVERARQHRVTETMAITSREDFLKACGFDYSLPGSKIALFLRTRDK